MKADDAALTQAALPGCRANCAKLLTDAKEAAKTELFMASLRGLAIIGGSIAVGLALHPRRKAKAHAAVADPREAEVIAKVEEIQAVKATPPPKRTSRRRAPHSSPLAITARPINEREHVSHFLRIAVRPDPNAETSLRKLNDRYPGWCREQSVDPLPPAQLGQQLRSIIDAIGLECVPTGKDVIIRRAALN